MKESCRGCIVSSLPLSWDLGKCFKRSFSVFGFCYRSVFHAAVISYYIIVELWNWNPQLDNLDLAIGSANTENSQTLFYVLYMTQISREVVILLLQTTVIIFRVTIDSDPKAGLEYEVLFSNSSYIMCPKFEPFKISGQITITPIGKFLSFQCVQDQMNLNYSAPHCNVLSDGTIKSGEKAQRKGGGAIRFSAFRCTSSLIWIENGQHYETVCSNLENHSHSWMCVCTAHCSTVFVIFFIIKTLQKLNP